jgi:hypothetical protein
MNPDLYDPPTYGGTPMQEAHAEMIQIFGMENPDRQWILSGYDVWERNPFYHGPEQQHPEDDTPTEEWEAWNALEIARAEKANELSHYYVPSTHQEDDCPF